MAFALTAHHAYARCASQILKPMVPRYALVGLGQLVEAVVDGMGSRQATALCPQAAHEDVGLHNGLKGSVQLLGLCMSVPQSAF